MTIPLYFVKKGSYWKNKSSSLNRAATLDEKMDLLIIAAVHLSQPKVSNL